MFFSAIFVLVMFLLGVHSKQSGYCALQCGYPKMKFSITISEEASRRRSTDTLYLVLSITKLDLRKLSETEYSNIRCLKCKVNFNINIQLQSS